METGSLIQDFKRISLQRSRKDLEVLITLACAWINACGTSPVEEIGALYELRIKKIDPILPRRQILGAFGGCNSSQEAD
jgi:hypothetical protein